SGRFARVLALCEAFGPCDFGRGTRLLPPALRHRPGSRPCRTTASDTRETLRPCPSLPASSALLTRGFLLLAHRAKRWFLPEGPHLRPRPGWFAPRALAPPPALSRDRQPVLRCQVHLYFGGNHRVDRFHRSFRY